LPDLVSRCVRGPCLPTGFAHLLQYVGNLPRLFDLDNPGGQTQVLQAANGQCGISALPGDNQVGLKVYDLFQVQPECITNTWQAGRPGRVVAVFHRGKELITGTRCKHELGQVW